MALTEKFAGQFSHTAQTEGEKIFQRGGVKFDDRAAEWVEATVSGGQPYGVFLEREKGVVRFACDCPVYTNSGVPCKHVWAALLAGESLGYFDQWHTTRNLDLLPDDDVLEIEEPAKYPRMPGELGGRPMTQTLRNSPSSNRRNRSTGWKQSIAELRDAMQPRDLLQHAGWPVGREVLYVIDVPRTVEGGGLVVEVNGRERRKDGNWGKPKRQSIRTEEVVTLPDARDREIVSLLLGAKSARDSFSSYYYSSYDYNNSSSSFRLGEAMLEPMIRRMCQTGRCLLRVDLEKDLLPIAWDESGKWELWIVARKDASEKNFVLSGELRRGEERMELSEPTMLVPGGLVFSGDRVAPFDDGGAYPWVGVLRDKQEIRIPAADREELLQQMLSLPGLPRLELPEELQVTEVKVTPQARLRIRKARKNAYYSDRLRGELSFDYEGLIVGDDEPGRGIYQPEQRRLILRDQEFEREASARIRALGFRHTTGYQQSPGYEIAPNNLPMVIRKLTAENWHVEADGQLYRQPGEIKIEVSSGIDWFELHGTADFGGQSVQLPQLLAALRRGEKTVRLGDGTFGVLPEQWLQKYGLLADMGTATEDHIRFGKSQVGLLDALLASQPAATCDAVFVQARQRMRNFDGVQAMDPPPLFTGTLRPYQREGLGWMQFLREFGFGGCLADDMGLGKTVQVLALLESRREMRRDSDKVLPPLPLGEGRGEGELPAPSLEQVTPSPVSPHPNPLPFGSEPQGRRPEGEGVNAQKRQMGPTLVVVPRSLIFNWQEEATKFAPNLKVLDHTGIGRAKSAEAFDQFDLILTTYGTLRNDITFLKDIDFDYLILDEAQAIKNASSESAKAVRLLHGEHRLALSGTPVQNHLGELWSLFEFLNPGMLGTARAFQATGATTRVVEQQTREMLSRALRPFILRRTKGQVAKDLPQRLEQTIHCELQGEQRKQYDELREHYRTTLLSRIAKEGIKKAKIQILEALLRLRQAACHPGLIDKSKTGMGSAKLDSLLAQLAEVMDEGHKVLVFSQFTSFLAIVRNRLDKENVKYEYLDGRTRDRATPVEHFQNDPECKLFLISLKAGGLGLNLTAAEYVFLLDPWWNPAVEAQAIDRAHRIGQTRQVFAYRLIAKNTVEEKVLQLQQTKRDLADAIINAENSVIGKLGKEDLELLLS
jgi:superfamily II DNA or RNA helicase